ncbi:DUF4752 domain-containing protein [Escherichia coli]
MMKACGEDGPKSVADKFAELESKLETALRECRSSGITIDNLEAKCAALAAKINVINELMEVAEQVNKLAQEETEKLAHERNTLAAENAGLKFYLRNGPVIRKGDELVAAHQFAPETQATDAFLAEVRASARNEGVNYAAGRLAAAFNHGFVDKPLAEVYDVVRMIMDTKEELADSTLPAADGLSGEYAEKFLEEFSAQLRQEAVQ